MSFQCYSAEQLHTDLIFKGKFSGISRHLYMRGIKTLHATFSHPSRALEREMSR